MKKLLLAATAALSMLATSPSFAYYSGTQNPEWVAIEPNESAFWVPNLGENQDSQADLDSEAYFAKNKIATKLFRVPNEKLVGGQYQIFGGNYASTGRLIIQSRMPYNGEWVNPQRGTGTSEGIECQSNEGISILIPIAIGASIEEKDAAKYLYNFGIEAPQGSREDPNVIFTSVYYGRPLEFAMARKVHGEVSTLICNAISEDSLLEDVKSTSRILKEATEKLKPWLSDRGITLDYLGYAGNWKFDPVVQTSINRTFASVQDKQTAVTLEPYKDTLLTLSAVDAIRHASLKWNGSLPSTFTNFSLGDLSAYAKSFLQAAPAAVIPTK